MNDFLRAAASATADAPDPVALDALAAAGLGGDLAEAGVTVPADDAGDGERAE